ncbi:hypothetical protein CS543_06775 [Porphyromonas gingivalis]|nr:hypothetical protein CS543_06775 [Porphyromonas gingivalis]
MPQIDFGRTRQSSIRPRCRLKKAGEKKSKDMKVYRREGAASVTSQLRILEPVIEALDPEVVIEEFDENFVRFRAPAGKVERLAAQIKQLLDTHVK